MEHVLALANLLYFKVVLIPQGVLQLLLTLEGLHANATHVVLGSLLGVEVLFIVNTGRFSLQKLFEVLAAELLVYALLVVRQVIRIVLLCLHVLVDFLQHLLVPFSLRLAEVVELITHQLAVV